MADLKITVDVVSLVDAKKKLTAFQDQMGKTNSVVGLTRALGSVERNIADLIRAQQKKQISDRTFNKGLLEQRKALEAMGMSSYMARKRVEELANALKAQQAASNGAAGSINRAGVITQQAGYQIGDFIVQVQSGTNFMVAFGQQATQVAGTLTLLGGKWIAIGSALGIAIPLITAIGAGLMRTSKDAEEATEAFEGIGESLRRLEEIRLNSLGESLADGARSAMEEWQPLFDLLERVESRALQENLSRSLTQTINELASASSQLQPRTNLPGIASLFGGRREIPTPQVGPFGFTDNESRAAVAQELLKIEGNTREELQASLAAAEDRLRQQELLTPQVENVLATIAEELGLVETVTGQLKDQNDLIAKGNSFLEERISDYTKTQDFINSQINNLNKEIALQEQIAKYGEDSVQVARLQAQFARNEYADRLRAAGAAEDVVERVMELYDANVASTEQADKTTTAMEELAGLNLSSLRAEIDFLIRRLNIGEEAARAMALAMPVGTSGTDAGRGGRGMTLGMAGRRPNFDRDLGLGRFADKPERERAGGQDPIQQLQQRLQLEQDLLGKTEAQSRVIQALGANWRDYDESAVAALIATAEQLDNTNRKIAEQQSIADTIKDSMGDAFMSMVDGTKTVEDAFKDMARSIIKQLYDVLVVQRLVGSFNATSKTGSGIVGAIGSALFRESGGSMMANRPYIVGERGPELVIPGRSSTVKNADLTNKAMGGSNGVTVVNNINVSGGTDPAAIRQEVAKLMPQITNATKSAVIDARRRGGQMKAAFG